MPHHNMHDYRVEREENGQTAKGRYAYELVLYVDDEKVKTASQLEREGYDGPEAGGANWTIQLKRWARAYIDGMEAE